MINTYLDYETMTNAGKAFSKEYLLTNGSGGFCSSTIGGCNTRKYHGLLVVPQPKIDGDDHLLISSLDEEISYRQEQFLLGTHYYPNNVYPAGYKHITEFTGNPVPKWIYHLDDCVLEKEIVMPGNEHATLIRYTITEASEKLQLTLKPFLAFRRAHGLTSANLHVNKKVQPVDNGIQVRLYEDYSHLNIQTSLKSEFIIAPDWYYRIEYPQEQSRGYAYSEDLFVPGHFSLTMKKGDKLIIHIGLKESNTKTLNTRFTNILKKKPLLNTEKECLLHAARQFVIQQDDEVRIKAGYPWFGCWGRDTFISLPGLLLVTDNRKEFKEVIKASVGDLKKGLIPNVGTGKNAMYNSVDASLWFIWAIQQYALFTQNKEKIWKDFGKPLVNILTHYKNGTLHDIKMDIDGLIFAGQKDMALTWMDAIVNGEPVTPRTGKSVEINALWYNAICFCLEVAELAGDKAFIKEWQHLPDTIRNSFIATFWNDEKQYLADCVNDGVKDWSVRPNQVFAISVPHSPVPAEMRKPILNIVREELLTPKGLRTLSPRDENYKGTCEGDQDTRDSAYHQGTIWPWLLGHYTEAHLKEYGQEGLQHIHDIRDNFSGMLQDQCLYTVPEIYNGDAPHTPTGAVAQAWSVAELLRMDYLLDELNTKEKNIK